MCRSLGHPTHLVPVYLRGHRCPRCQTMSAIARPRELPDLTVVQLKVVVLPAT